jgi:hypothetical protein
MDKNWNVTFKLPQLVAHRAWQSTDVVAANFGLAVNRAWAVVKKRPEVKGRRIDECEIKVRKL